MSVPAMVSRLEAAAAVFVGVPQPEARKEAEELFAQLRASPDILTLAPAIIEATSSPFVIFQAVGGLKERVLREWSLLEEATIRQVWQYLLLFVTNHPRCETFLANEILQAISSILKRGTFDSKCGSSEDFFASINQLIASPDLHLQSLGCQMLLALCSEYCSSWRSSGLGITWDFHTRAKRHFETADLQRILRLSLELLQTLVGSAERCAGAEGRAVVGRLLRVCETVLTWHFGSRLLPRRLTFALEFSPAQAFRPPAAWKDLLLAPQTLPFFFKLHELVRGDAGLGHHSLQCLGQLASLSGVVFAAKSPGESQSSREDYLQSFIGLLLSTFSGSVETEAGGLAALIGKLLTYHPLPELRRLPPPCLDGLLKFSAGLTLSLCPAFAQEAAGEPDETPVAEALEALLGGWAGLLRAESRIFRGDAMLQPYAQQIFSALLKALMAPPFGTRPKGSSVEGGAEVDEEEERSDREQYGDLLGSLRVIGRHSLAHSMGTLAELLCERLSTFAQFLASPSASFPEASAFLLSWQEDMHWLTLIIGTLLAEEDVDLSTCAPMELVEWMANSTQPLDLDEARAFLATALRDPGSLNLAATANPWLRLVGGLLMWASVQLGMGASEAQRQLLSPQLWQSSLWAVRRLASAYHTPKELFFPAFLPAMGERAGVPLEPPPVPVVMRVLQEGSELSQLVFDFCLRLAMESLRVWSGDAGVARDAVSLIGYLAEHRSTEATASGSLESELGGLELSRLVPSVRRRLVSALVIMGAATERAEIQGRLSTTLLEPLSRRFAELGAGLVKGGGGAEASQILDVLDCFAGVADAAQPTSAHFLYKYLEPVLGGCVTMMGKSQEMVVVNAVLDLFSSISKHMGLYLDSQEDSTSLYDHLYRLLQAYASVHSGRFQSKEIQEEQASDLGKMMKILANVLAKDLLVMSFSQEGGALNKAATVALRGLELVCPLMGEELLGFPSLAVPYFNLLLFVSEMFPESVAGLPPHMLQLILNSARLGLTSQYGNEVMRTSVELINVLGSFGLQSDIGAAKEVAKALTVFMKPMFESCLSTSCEVDVFGDAALTLYTLICCDPAGWASLVEALVGAESDARRRAAVSAAFAALQPEPPVALRKERRAFRDRLERFLDEIQGLLCL